MLALFDQDVPPHVKLRRFFTSSNLDDTCICEIRHDDYNGKVKAPSAKLVFRKLLFRQKSDRAMKPEKEPKLPSGGSHIQPPLSPCNYVKCQKHSILTNAVF